jgi:hypothetical protein
MDEDVKKDILTAITRLFDGDNLAAWLLLIEGLAKLLRAEHPDLSTTLDNLVIALLDEPQPPLWPEPEPEPRPRGRPADNEKDLSLEDIIRAACMKADIARAKGEPFRQRLKKYGIKHSTGYNIKAEVRALKLHRARVQIIDLIYLKYLDGLLGRPPF